MTDYTVACGIFLTTSVLLVTCRYIKPDATLIFHLLFLGIMICEICRGNIDFKNSSEKAFHPQMTINFQDMIDIMFSSLSLTHIFVSRSIVTRTL